MWMKEMLDWAKYSKSFKREAHKAGYDDQYIEKCLNYAKCLSEKGLPIIYDQEHLAALTGYNIEYLRRASNAPNLFYRRFKIPKKSRGFREISEPLPSLKEIQQWILNNILYQCTVSKFAKAFKHQCSIRDNARFHRGQRSVLSLDIKNFFSSIPTSRVFTFFNNCGYSKEVVTMLTNLCTSNNALPQGAPTSPALSNLLSMRMDKRLSKYALKRKLRYTRYADDLTFSGECDVGSIIRIVSTVLKDDGLQLNTNKTHLMRPCSRQVVTGIIVNKKMQAPREIRRNLRQDIYYIEKYGLDSHMQATGRTRAGYINHLRGIANFILFVNSKDRDAKHAIEVIADIT
jgi:RNA-directed DNA polymerase